MPIAPSKVAGEVYEKVDICPVCDGSGLLLKDACPLCVEQLLLGKEANAAPEAAPTAAPEKQPKLCQKKNQKRQKQRQKRRQKRVHMEVQVVNRIPLKPLHPKSGPSGLIMHTFVIKYKPKQQSATSYSNHQQIDRLLIKTNQTDKMHVRNIQGRQFCRTKQARRTRQRRKGLVKSKTIYLYDCKSMHVKNISACHPT
jgi:pyruvate/2-oxoglutarate dehydrogenase complex dihydrolipoamide acyltransferase (E2) component